MAVIVILVLMSPYAKRILGITMPSLKEYTEIVQKWVESLKEKGYDSFDDITTSDIMDLVNMLWNLLVNHFVSQFGIKVKYNP